MIHETAIIGEPPEDRGVQQSGYSFGWQHPVVDDSAYVGAYATIDAGKERPTSVGAHTWVMKHVHLGHDVLVGEECEIAPGAVLCGYAIVRDRVKVGVNASILPYVCVGEGAVVGAGAVVTRHVLPGAVVAGSPARRIGGANPAFVQGPGDLRCGCWAHTTWYGCPHHGTDA